MCVSEATACRVFDVQRCCLHDGPGIRTTVFLEGCPLRCGWCQNPEAFVAGRAPALTPEEVVAEVLRDRAWYAASGGGLTVSGGEPLLHLAPARALLAEARRHGLHTCVQTSGAVPQAHLASVLGLVDLFQLDLKHQDPERHRALTGAGTERIHANAAFLLAQGAAVQFRLPVVPSVNDGDENLDALAAFLRGLGVRDLRLVPYHRLYLDKYAALGLVPGLPGLQSASAEDLRRVAARLQQHGVATEVDGELRL